MAPRVETELLLAPVAGVRPTCARATTQARTAWWSQVVGVEAGQEREVVPEAWAEAEAVVEDKAVSESMARGAATGAMEEQAVLEARVGMAAASGAPGAMEEQAATEPVA